MRKIRSDVKVLSLFSGVGGFDMGFEQAGYTTAFQCEIDKHARAVLDHHWPDVPKWDDVTTLTGAHILEMTGGVDVVIWGSPCQDLSLAGKRAGLSGERSGLFHEGIRIIKELRELSNGQYPTWSVWENVVGALSSNGGADFGEVLYEMDEAGACFSEWTVLDAQYFGVPQRRRRVFVTSCFDPATSERCGSPLFPVAESVSGHSAKGGKARKGSAGSSEEGIGAGGSTGTGYVDDNGVLRGTVTSKWHKGTGGPVGDEAYNLVVEPVANTLRVGSGIGERGDGSDNLVVEPVHVDGSNISPTLRGFGHGWQGQQNSTHAVIQPGTFVKSRRAQSAEDHETWVESDVAPTLNLFDQGDVRATTAIIEVDPIGTLQSRSYKGPNHEAARDGQLIVESVPLSFDTQFGSNAAVFEDQSPTLKASQQSPSVAYPIDTRNALRDPDKHDAVNRQGTGIGEDGDPSPTLTNVFTPAVAYSNDETDSPMLIDGRRVGDVRVYTEPVQTLQERMGTGGNNVPVIAQEVTVFAPSAARKGGQVWDDVVPTLRAEGKQGDNTPHVIQETTNRTVEQEGSNE